MRQAAARARANAKLREGLRDIYQHVDAHQARQMRLYPDPPVSCKKGCSACCEMLVEVELVEAENIVARHPDAVRRALPTIRRHAALLKTMPDMHGLGGSKPACDAWWQAQEPCALLVDGACSVYEDRPMMCRTYFVASRPRLCAVRPKAMVAIVHMATRTKGPVLVSEMVARVHKGRTTLAALPEALALAVDAAQR